MKRPDRRDPSHALFPHLAKRGMATTWSERATPQDDLWAECSALSQDTATMAALKSFLNDNPIVVASLESMMAQLAMAAGSNWKETDKALQPLSRRGHSIGRWLPS